MFELSVALKYLIPRKKQLSVSLIALLSVTVISLVVWLVLVFLSVTEGIERSWLQKLTTLNAPLKITPTPEYFSSYYYQIDGVSSKSDYTFKTIAEKLRLSSLDPYNPEEDGQLPLHIDAPDLTSEGVLKDPVKGLFSALGQLEKSHPDLVYQDFELSGALMRLQLLRQEGRPGGGSSQSYLTQVSYLASLPDKCPKLSSLILPITETDVNHLLYLGNHSTELSRQDMPALQTRASQEKTDNRTAQVLEHVQIKQLKPTYALWQIPVNLLPENQIFGGSAHYRQGKLIRITIPTEKGLENPLKIRKEANGFVIENKEGEKQSISLQTPILAEGPLFLDVKDSTATPPFLFKVNTLIQGISIEGITELTNLEIAKVDVPRENAPNSSWLFFEKSRAVLPINEEKETGVLLAKGFLENGVRIGDRGYLSYSSTTSSSLQEHRLPIFVASFYDPGIFSVGNKCILVPSFVTSTINASSSSFNLDKTQSCGVLVWFDDLNLAEEMKGKISLALSDLGLEKYWKVTSFREYDFAQDLMQQFQSDKHLFALVGIIILIVACCNIISMLVLLVNDKRREIGILQAMGATPLSIAAIFGVCGIVMGILSSVIGTVAALFTLHHIDAIVGLLSYLQGHSAFNSTFFGKSLPGELSQSALTFILITTPILSLLAGLVPAIKAAKLRPSEILRAE